MFKEPGIKVKLSNYNEIEQLELTVVTDPENDEYVNISVGPVHEDATEDETTTLIISEQQGRELLQLLSKYFEVKK